MTVDPTLLTGLGAAVSIFLSATGSAIASAHSGVYAIRVQHDLGAKGLIPIVISGVLSIYGIIISVLLIGKMTPEEGTTLSEADGYRFLSAGLAVGLACWADSPEASRESASLHDHPKGLIQRAAKASLTITRRG